MNNRIAPFFLFLFLSSNFLNSALEKAPDSDRYNLLAEHSYKGTYLATLPWDLKVLTNKFVHSPDEIDEMFVERTSRYVQKKGNEQLQTRDMICMLRTKPHHGNGQFRIFSVYNKKNKEKSEFKYFKEILSLKNTIFFSLSPSFSKSIVVDTFFNRDSVKELVHVYNLETKETDIFKYTRCSEKIHPCVAVAVSDGDGPVLPNIAQVWQKKDGSYRLLLIKARKNGTTSQPVIALYQKKWDWARTIKLKLTSIRSCAFNEQGTNVIVWNKGTKNKKYEIHSVVPE